MRSREGTIHSPRSVRAPLAVVVGFAFAPAVLALGGGCGGQHIGRPCELGAAVDAGSRSGATTTIASPALECPSRICLLPGAQLTGDGTGPLCTATCSNDGDCAGGEIDPNPDGPGCKNGFGCMWPTTVGDFCCQKMCVCLDFVMEPSGGFTEPEVCTRASFGCKNVR